MWNMIWPMILIVLSNCFYNICTKSTPENVNTFGALTVTYLIGAMLSAILFVSSVGLEAGYVFLYRAGWKVSNGALTANICLAIALIVIGFLLYKETICLRQVLGIVVCGIGLFLINH